MPESVKDIVVCETNPDDMDNDVDIVFSSLPTEFAAKVEKAFAKDYVVASNASAHRMKKNIPLVIPEVNPEFLDMIEAQQKEKLDRWNEKQKKAKKKARRAKIKGIFIGY